MELPFAAVQSIVHAEEAEDGFLTYNVNLSDSSVETIIRMIWKGAPASGDHGVHYTFSNGVTYDRATGHLRVPPGVKSFSLSRRVEYDDSLAFVLNPGLELNGTGVAEDNPDQNIEGGEMLANSNRSAVKSIVIRNPNAIEASKFVLTVNVNPQKRAAYAAIRVTGLGARDVDTLRQMAFSHGVKLHGNGKDLVIPKGVTRFNITIDIKDDGIVERDERLRLQVGNKFRDLMIAATAEVTRVTAIDRIEGGSLKFTVNVRRSNWKTRAYFGVKYTNGQATDIAVMQKWSVTNGVRIDVKNRNFIIPAGVTSFTINIPTVDDVFAEPSTGIQLRVGNRADSAVIWDDAEVASVKGIGALEGTTVQFVVTLKRASSYGSFVQLSVGLGSKPATTKDIEPMSKWTVSNGVKLKNGYFYVPPKTRQFTVRIKTIPDALFEGLGGETLRLSANGVSGTALIREPAKIKRVLYDGAKFTEGSSRIVTVYVDPFIAPRRLTYSLGGSAMYNYSTSLSFNGVGETSREWKQRSKQGIIYIPPNQKSFTIKISLPGNKKYSGDDNLILGLGGQRYTFRVTDDLSQVKRVLGSMGTPIVSGFVNNIQDRQRISVSVSLGGSNFFLSQMAKWRGLLDEQTLARFRPGETVKDFLGRTVDEVRLIRENKKSELKKIIGFLYTDFKPSLFFGSGTPDLVAYYAHEYVKLVVRSVWDGLLQFQRMRVLFTELLLTAQESEQNDRIWFMPGNLTSLDEDFDLAVNRMNYFFEVTGQQFDTIKSVYAQSKAVWRRDYIFDVITTTFAVAAGLGSIGFAVSNFRAVHKQMKDYRRDPNKSWSKFLTTLRDKGVNAPASAGSITLFLNNAAQSIINGMRTAPIVSNRLLDVRELKLSLDANLEAVSQNVKTFTQKFESLLHFMFLNGAAGNEATFIREVTVLQSEPFPADRFVNEPGYTFAWYDNMNDLDDSFGKKTARQRLWGILEEKLPAQHKIEVTTPVALDLTGEGLRFKNIGAGAGFDANDDGMRDPIAWVDGGTALLAFDIDGDNVISQTGEISFIRYKEGATTDLEGLAAFDSDQDGVFSIHDAMWHRFGVWQDRNGDGQSDVGEFKSLADHGIVAISLTSDRQASEQGDVLIYGRSQFWRADGSVGTVGDVGFRYVA